MPTLYIAGPMSGLPRWNFDAFAEAADSLRAAGYDVVSPHEIDLACGFDPDDPEETFTLADWHEAMRRDVEALLHVDGVALLPGWQRSSGAFVEAVVADAIGLPVNPLGAWLASALAQEGAP